MQDIDTSPPKVRKRRPTYSAAEIIEALRGTNGMVFIAAERLGCDPSTIHRRANTNKAIRAAIEKHRGKALDTAELALMAAVQNKEPWAIAFMLKTIGKQRGYVERQEIAAVPAEQLDASIDRELARLAGPGKATISGTAEEQADARAKE